MAVGDPETKIAMAHIGKLWKTPYQIHRCYERDKEGATTVLNQAAQD